MIRKDRDGRYQVDVETPGPYAKWLPNVTVWVCEGCNSGWMSSLESEAKVILAPFIVDNSNVQLSTTNLRTLTTWATKSWMAYALTRPGGQNPFTEAEYRSMAVSPSPLGRSRVWLMHSQEARAHVGMGIASTLLSSTQAPPDMEATQDNMAYAYLAVATVVMVMVVAPEEAPVDLLDALTPQELSSPVVRRSWPKPRPQSFPLGPIPDADLATLIEYPSLLFDAIGLPVVGLTDADTTAVLREFLAGADPRELRSRWDEP